MSWSAWGNTKGGNQRGRDDAPPREKRNAWFHGRYRAPVWGLTAAMCASVYLRYFNGPSFESKGQFEQFVTIGLPIAIALGSAWSAFLIFQGVKSKAAKADTEQVR